MYCNWQKIYWWIFHLLFNIFFQFLIIQAEVNKPNHQSKRIKYLKRTTSTEDYLCFSIKTHNAKVTATNQQNKWYIISLIPHNNLVQSLLQKNVKEQI